MLNWLKRHRTAVTLGVIFVLLTLMPLIFWGPYHFIGGDDSRLYYLFTSDYLKNYASNLFTGVHMGGQGYYYPIIANWPTAAMILVIKSIIPFISPEFLVLGLNLAVGFLAFYSLLDNFIQRDRPLAVSIKIVSSLSYCLSGFLYFTVYGALWPALFLVSLAPILIHLFIKGLRHRQPAYIVLSSVVAAILANILTNLAWFMGLIIVLLPLLLYLFVTHRSRLVRYGFLFGILYLLMSSYWLVHFVAAPLNTSDGDNNPVARVGKQLASEVMANDTIIQAVAGKNEVMYPMLGAFHKSILVDFKWSGLAEYQSWTIPLLFLSTFFLMVIAGAAVTVTGDERRVYIAVLSSWLLALYMFTAHITTHGLNLFLLLNRYVPGFSMFRNMYDKFGLAMAFSTALLLAVSLQAVTEKRARAVSGRLIVALALLVVLVNSKPFVDGKKYQQPFRTTKYEDTITDFNSDFYGLVAKLNQIDDDARIMWLPLASGNYLPLQDAQLPDHYYAGTSPLKVLTNKNDYTGSFSFYPRGDMLLDLLLRGQYVKAASFLKEAGVGYIIVNHDVDQEWQKSYLYSLRKTSDLYRAQGAAWKQELLGEKIGEFGEHYSLYRIKDKYYSEKLYSTRTSSYDKTSDTAFNINLKVADSQPLYLLEPYHKLWRLYARPIDGSGERRWLEIAERNHVLVFDYANQWTLTAEEIKSLGNEYYTANADGTVSAQLTAEFVPGKWSPYLNSFSVFVLISSLVYVGLDRRRAKNKLKSR
jgi:hypothetical protein